MNYTLTKEQVRHIFELGFIHGVTDVGRGELDKYLEGVLEESNREYVPEIGETFEKYGLKLKCLSGYGCQGCCFSDRNSCVDLKLNCEFKIFKIIVEDEQ